MMPRRRLLLITGLAASLAAAGCQPLYVASVAAPMVYRPEHVNLLNTSYAAADILAQQSSKRHAINAPLIVESLQEVPNPDRYKNTPSPRIGRELGDQMRTRFVELGYNVLENQPSFSARPPGSAVITGAYKLSSRKTIDIDVRMRLSDTGEVIAIHRYTLPLTSDIRRFRGKQ